MGNQCSCFTPGKNDPGMCELMFEDCCECCESKQKFSSVDREESSDDEEKEGAVAEGDDSSEGEYEVIEFQRKPDVAVMEYGSRTSEAKAKAISIDGIGAFPEPDAGPTTVTMGGEDDEDEEFELGGGTPNKKKGEGNRLLR